MPLYPFQCQNKKCGYIYEVLTKYDKTGKYKAVVCPKCNSKKKKDMPYSFGFNFTNPEGTDKWRSHDYRFKHNLPKVLEERKRAEMASKMGNQPYNQIDDLNNGDNFGEVE